MRVLYSLLFYLAMPAVLLYLAWRSRKDVRWRQRWSERLGAGGPGPKAGGIVVHAASVGEVNAAAPLVRALLARPGLGPITVSTFTPTGAARAATLFGDDVGHTLIPLDLPGATRRFMRRLRPRLVVVMETEIWPNLYHAAARAKVPIMLANARLTERSLRGYRRFAPLVRGALARVRIALAQSETDAARLAEAGLPAERVHLVGNLKFDLDLPPGLADRATSLRAQWGGERPVLIAASTHAEDDPVVLAAFETLRANHPDALLILVPRHPERFEAAAAAAQERGLRTRRYSQGPACLPDTDCFVIDTMGELLNYYACSDVAFIGGSFGPTGGHNPLEAAALGLPVLSGPNMDNFSELSRRLADSGALRQVSDQAELAQLAAALLDDPERRDTMGRAGRALVESGRGALRRTLTEIETLLG